MYSQCDPSSGLIGASVFISTVVLGTIILLTSVTKDSIGNLGGGVCMCV